MVYLRRGYSLDQHILHMEFVGIYLKPLMDGSPILFDNAPFGLMYGAKLDDAALAAVRGDTGVFLVECDEIPQLAVLRPTVL
jgi:hypothetical protein